MRQKQQWFGMLLAAVLGGLASMTAVAAAGEQFLPVLVTREGAVRSFQAPRADGYIAYLTLLNECDGGINGVKLVWEECETVFDATRTVECYERLKTKGPTGAAVFHPHGTPPTYALIERATQDRIPLITVGYGRADAADGRVFPYVFNPPTSYWSQNTAKIRFIGHRAGGMAQLKGLKAAAQIGFPRDKIVGAAGTCTEQEMILAGEAARGFICVSLFGTGRHFPLIQDILTYVYAGGKGPGPEGDVGTVVWSRGVMHGVLTAEALRTAMRRFGNQPLTGAQVQWGLDHLTLTAASLKELGAEGLFPPISLSCRDHEGGGSVQFQQWDGTQWTVLTDWIAPDQALVRPLMEASAAKYAQEKGITPRTCP
jgi:branched-chain amino acid transport system substrate-binding protein